MEQRFVATDRDGVQHLSDRRRAWPLPGPSGEPGEPARRHEDEHDALLLDADGLLDGLAERIFLAEPMEGGARLVRELDWDLPVTATFALDCAEHALGVITGAGAVEQLLPDGSSLGEVIAEAREYLASAGESEDRHLGALSRLSLARRLGHGQSQVADLALATVREDEDADVDALEDPRWTSLAALSSALLACVEVLRHLALPRYVSARERVVESEGEEAPEVAPAWVTPWGPVAPVAGHLPGYVPAYVSAREAAGRARQAVAEQSGQAAGEAERAYQRQHLIELIGAGS